MTAFDRDKLRDELAKHELRLWGPKADCDCNEFLGYIDDDYEGYKLFCAHQADVALAWVEAQMSEERNSRIEPLGDRAFGSVWYHRFVTRWEPVEGGTE